MATSKIICDQTIGLNTAISIQTSGLSYIYAFITVNVVVTDIVLYPTEDMAANTQLGSVSLPRNLSMESHMPVLSASGNMARLRMERTGRISVENAVAKNQWIAVSMVGALS